MKFSRENYENMQTVDKHENGNGLKRVTHVPNLINESQLFIKGYFFPRRRMCRIARTVHSVKLHSRV